MLYSNKVEYIFCARPWVMLTQRADLLHMFFVSTLIICILLWSINLQRKFIQAKGLKSTIKASIVYKAIFACKIDLSREAFVLFKKCI